MKLYEAIDLSKKNSLQDKVPSPRDIIQKLKQDKKEKKKMKKLGSGPQSPSKLCFDQPSSEEDFEFTSENKPKAPKYMFKDNIDVDDFFRLGSQQ